MSPIAIKYSIIYTYVCKQAPNLMAYNPDREKWRYLNI